MADVKITALPGATTITDDDLFVGVDSPSSGAATKKWTGAVVRTYVTTNVGTPASATDAANKQYVDAAAGANVAAARLYLWANYS